MEREITFVFEESPQGGYEAHALGYAIFTQADTLDELRQMVHDAARCYFDEAQNSQSSCCLSLYEVLDIHVPAVVCLELRAQN